MSLSCEENLRVPSKPGGSPVAVGSATPVMVLAYVFPPDNYTGADRPHRFVKYLRRLGHPVRVLAAGSEDGLRHQGEDVYRVRGELEHIPRVNRVEQLLRIACFWYDEGPTWIPRAIRAASEWIRESPNTVVFSTSPPIVTHLAALRLKRKYGVRWIADFRDPLYGNPFRTLQRVRFFDRLFERQIFRHADVVLANTAPVAEIWRQRYPKFSGKIQVMWNGFDPETVPKPLARAAVPQRLLTHVGTIYGTRQPAILLKSLERLVARGCVRPDSFRLRLIGPAHLDEASSALITRLRQLEIVQFRQERISREESGELTAESDLLLLLDVLENGAGLQVPSKLFEYVMIGRPILALTVRGSAVEGILAGSGIPHTCLYPDMTADDADTALLKFLQLSSDPVQPSPWFCDTFDSQIQSSRLSALITGSDPTT